MLVSERRGTASKEETPKAEVELPCRRTIQEAAMGRRGRKGAVEGASKVVAQEAIM